MEAAKKLSAVAGWKQIYRDSQFAMFARVGLMLPTVISDADPPDGIYP
jgi:hypothetical protein